MLLNVSRLIQHYLSSTFVRICALALLATASLPAEATILYDCTGSSLANSGSYSINVEILSGGSATYSDTAGPKTGDCSVDSSNSLFTSISDVGPLSGSSGSADAGASYLLSSTIQNIHGGVLFQASSNVAAGAEAHGVKLANGSYSSVDSGASAKTQFGQGFRADAPFYYNLTAHTSTACSFIAFYFLSESRTGTCRSSYAYPAGLKHVSGSYSAMTSGIGASANVSVAAGTGGIISDAAASASTGWNYSLFLSDTPFQGTSATDAVTPSSVASDGTLNFSSPVPGLWFDPPSATGFTYSLTSGSFIDITTPSGSGFPTNAVDLYIGDLLTATLNPGDTYTFDPGISSFSLFGVDPTLEYPVLLDFTSGASNLAIKPVLASESVPEPPSIALLGLGLIGVAYGRRRRPSNQGTYP